MSMQNPYKVIAGFVNTSVQDVAKCQIRLGIKAMIHPNPVVVFALIKVNIFFNIYIISLS